MRSEERAGIVAAVLLLLWGTFLAFPLHQFTVFLERIAGNAVGVAAGSAPVIAVQIVKILIMSGIEVFLLLISKTRFACYIPVSVLLMTSVSFVLRSVQTRSFDTKTGVALAIVLVLTALIHLLRAEKILLWEGDLFIYSISVHLITSIVAAPLAASYGFMDKILYIVHYHDTDMSGAFEGFLTLPAFVWGLFLVILLSLPVVYYSFSRKKA